MLLRNVLLSLFLYSTAYAQPCGIGGIITDSTSETLPGAYVSIYKGADTLRTLSDADGRFSFGQVGCGSYRVEVRYTGYALYSDTVAADGVMRSIVLQRSTQRLREVAIVQRAPVAVQRGDTMEYSASAYKVHADADAADMVRKMPSIDISDKVITAGGEAVTRVMVDGIPFYGNAPYASLKNLPAHMIDRVQVYTELTDMEQYTGFREGAGTKTINIVTQANKRHGVFGNAYGGMGNDNTGDERYGTGLSLNSFEGPQRIAANVQGNNVNRQNLTDMTAAPGGSGMSSTAGGGLSYAGNLHGAEISASYAATQTANTLYNDTRRIYITPATEGQIYDEHSPTSNEHTNHMANVRITTHPDAASTLVVAPQLMVQRMGNTVNRSGTTTENGAKLNETTNSNKTQNNTLSMGGNATYTRQLHKGRAVTADVDLTGTTGSATTLLQTEDTYYSTPYAERSTDQRTDQTTRGNSLTTALAYTLPAGKKGQTKLQYNTTWRKTDARRNANEYSPATNSYSVPDSLHSSAYTGMNTAHKAGLSYQRNAGALRISGTVYGQYSLLQNEQTVPQETDARFAFYNVLPGASLQYTLRRGRHIELTYNTDTRTPSVTDMQEVVTNTDPLHLTTGNPRLRQAYSHNIKLRGSATARDGSRTAALMVSGNHMSNYISRSTAFATADTMINNVLLQRGGQLTRPVNAQGYRYYAANASYSMPLTGIKCKLSVFANADATRVPLSINASTGFMYISSGNISVKVVSNISEAVDFSVQARSMYTTTSSTLNDNANVYYSQEIRPSLNLTVLHRYVVSSEADIRFNSGLQAGYNQNFVLWNVAVGRKIFRKQQGDIRVSVYDVLNRNTSIRHNIGDTYIEDTRTNILQRYALLTFTYKISSFRE